MNNNKKSLLNKVTNTGVKVNTVLLLVLAWLLLASNLFFSGVPLFGQAVQAGHSIEVDTIQDSVEIDSYADIDVNNSASFSTDTIYQIITDRFFNGNPTNDPSGDIYNPQDNRKYHGGDWQGIVDKMDYLVGMGISAIWISSPVENLGVVDPSNQSAGYHGYWGHDFFRSNPYFGSFNDFSNLVQVAHSRGIKVVIDFAPNHTSTADFPPYNFVEDGALYSDGNLLGQLHNDPNGIFNHESWTDFSTWENSIYHSLYGLADLNQANPTVDNYMKDSINMWLDMGVDGIRVDAVKHMPLGWQKNWVSSIYSHKPVFMFGEWFAGGTGSDEEMNTFANESGMSLLDFRYANAVRGAVGDLSGSMYDIHNTILGTAYDFNQVNNQVTFIDNHDMSRFATLSNNYNHSTDLAYVLQMTQRGVPAIYYGSEQYATGASDPDNRADMPAFNTNTNAYQIISKLAPLRKTNPALAYGTYNDVYVSNDVYLYERQFGDDIVLTAVNRNTSSGLDLTSLFTSLPQGTYTDVLGGIMGGSDLTVYNGGNIPEYYLGAGVVAVWAYKATVTSITPLIGNVDQHINAPNHISAISGRGFGTSIGTVSLYNGSNWFNASVATWSDSYINFFVPSVAAGKYQVFVSSLDGHQSYGFSNFTVLSGEQVLTRFIVNNATTSIGENVFIVGSVYELSNWGWIEATNSPMFKFFNATPSIASYPNWFLDISVPANSIISFKFIKKDINGNIVWEGGDNHTLNTSGQATQIVVNWQD